jgi:hypothetical protein
MIQGRTTCLPGSDKLRAFPGGIKIEQVFREEAGENMQEEKKERGESPSLFFWWAACCLPRAFCESYLLPATRICVMPAARRG